MKINSEDYSQHKAQKDKANGILQALTKTVPPRFSSTLKLQQMVARRQILAVTDVS